MIFLEICTVVYSTIAYFLCIVNLKIISDKLLQGHTRYYLHYKGVLVYRD